MARDADIAEDEAAGLDLAGLERALRERVDGEVRFDAGSRGAYATDGSNYRQVPLGVVVPRNLDAGATAVEVCARFGAPVLSRGGGTSLGGQCTNTAVVIDWTKYCHRLVSVDAESRTCVVEPGIVPDELNRQLSGYGLTFGPKPSTHSHCSLGGMIGNNSCGASAQAYGKTVDNVRRLEILTYGGLRCRVGPTSPEEYEAVMAAGGRKAELHRDLRELTDRHLADIRTGFPKLQRRMSGYNLDSLLPENGFDVARALVGSEGTLVTVLRAELELVLADGFSCRTQIEQGGTGRRAMHLAEAPALGLDGTLPDRRPEGLLDRPAASPRDGRLLATAVCTVVLAAAAAVAVRSNRQR